MSRDCCEIAGNEMTGATVSALLWPLVVLVVIGVCVPGSRAAPGWPPAEVGPGWQRLLEEGNDCPPCEAALCAVPRGCGAGAVRDRCGCCWECGNVEGQLCDLDHTNHFYGLCGDGLDCRLELAGLAHGEVPEPQCVCRHHLAVCGSDGSTYPQLCRFQQAANANQSANLTLAHQGPCEAVPQIISPPFSVWNTTGEDVIFGCEIFAYPMAAVEWRKEGLETFLPGDDPHISVQFRGGPLKYEVSGWLQIQGIRSSDAGVYLCCAHNKLGEVSAAANLTVLSADELGEAGTLWGLAQPPLDDDVDTDDYY